MAAVLRLTLTLIPRGNEREAREIGMVEIENDQAGTEALGNYKVRMRGTLHSDRDLLGVARTCGPWWLAAMALRELLDG